jgi:hypothetical protein
VIVKLFSKSIEKIADEEEEQEEGGSLEKKRIKDFLENPLLLEQFEAQLFSIIRQNLNVSTQDP